MPNFIKIIKIPALQYILNGPRDFLINRNYIEKCVGCDYVYSNGSPIEVILKFNSNEVYIEFILKFDADYLTICDK